jgi:hypothetical protein
MAAGLNEIKHVQSIISSCKNQQPKKVLVSKISMLAIKGGGGR